MRTEEKILTDLLGKRVPKDDPRFELWGAIDEANSALGLARAITKNNEVSKIIYQIQQELFGLATRCIIPSENSDELQGVITLENVEQLKNITDKIAEKIEPAKGWVISGDTPSSAALHLSRAIIRRAERIAVKLRRQFQIDGNSLLYLNQLSNLLFSLARFEACACVPICESQQKKN